MATRDLKLVLWLIFVIINNTAKYENQIRLSTREPFHTVNGQSCEGKLRETDRR